MEENPYQTEKLSAQLYAREAMVLRKLRIYEKVNLQGSNELSKQLKLYQAWVLWLASEGKNTCIEKWTVFDNQYWPGQRLNVKGNREVCKNKFTSKKM